MTVFSTIAAGRDRTVPATIRRPSGEGGALLGHGGRVSDDAKIAAFPWHRSGVRRGCGSGVGRAGECNFQERFAADPLQVQRRRLPGSIVDCGPVEARRWPPEDEALGGGRRVLSIYLEHLPFICFAL
jgi:hypothetical protein